MPSTNPRMLRVPMSIRPSAVALLGMESQPDLTSAR